MNPLSYRDIYSGYRDLVACHHCNSLYPFSRQRLFTLTDTKYFCLLDASVLVPIHCHGARSESGVHEKVVWGQAPPIFSGFHRSRTSQKCGYGPDHLFSNLF